MKLAGIGSAIPRTHIKTEEIEKHLGLQPGWIERRTGVRVLPTALPEEATSDLAVCAGRRALLDAQISPDEIGLLILATSTPDYPLPPTAPQVAHRLGLKRAGAVDLAGACAGFLYALAFANFYGEANSTACLVIGANVLSRRVDRSDPSTASLFADGAGAFLLVPGEGILSVHFGSDGEHWDEIVVWAGGSREPLTPEAVAEGKHLMRMKDGAGLFRHAVRRMAEVGRITLEKAGIALKDIDWWIPHQANRRLIREAGKLLGISADKTIDVVARCGNSSAATIPIAFDVARSEGRIREGNLLLFTAVGAGMLEAGVILKFGSFQKQRKNAV
ncbi:MAG: beta-ketoacyl-ACP synthase 3 [Acidobacteria bacterium]|nr:MAG: beta-ketoacyl-ACP synthase 3 [Acidobacteriota bacterium]GIU81290.1 MAG: 3-oxoacyl-ACP synthase [Pyrinomonadaceae bacterium]